LVNTPNVSFYDRTVQMKLKQAERHGPYGRNGQEENARDIKRPRRLFDWLIE